MAFDIFENMKLKFFILLIVFTLLSANDPEEYDILEASNITLIGSTNVGSFRCENNLIAKREENQTIQATPTSMGFDLTGVNFSIPVDGFSCKIPGMESDIRKLLNVDTYPEIELDLVHLQIPSGDYGTARARIKIAGKERMGLIDFKLISSKPHFHMVGSTPLYLTEFGLEPPTKMLGMIVVRDQIQIEFNLVLKINKATGTE